MKETFRRYFKEKYGTHEWFEDYAKAEKHIEDCFNHQQVKIDKLLSCMREVSTRFNVCAACGPRPTLCGYCEISATFKDLNLDISNADL